MIETLDDPFLRAPKDVPCAERRIPQAMPRPGREATDPRLGDALSVHRAETGDHARRPGTVFDILDAPARGAKRDAMDGPAGEAEGPMAGIDDTETLDAAPVSHAQAILHDEIARTGTPVAWAGDVGHAQVGKLRNEPRDRDHAAGRTVSPLAPDRAKAPADA